jgi:hypothetical protein
MRQTWSPNDEKSRITEANEETGEHRYWNRSHACTFDGRKSMTHVRSLARVLSKIELGGRFLFEINVFSNRPDCCQRNKHA